jgi:hypothetical protein
MEGSRFRDTAQVLRWRPPDHDPKSRGFGQFEEPTGFDLCSVAHRQRPRAAIVGGFSRYVEPVEAMF